MRMMKCGKLRLFLENLYPDPQVRKKISEITVLSRNRSKRLARFETTITTKNLEPRHVAFSVCDVRDKGRYLDVQIVQIEDFTARVDALEALKRLERIYGTSQRLAKVGGWEADVISQQSFWSEETYRIFGLEPGHDFLNIYDSAEHALDFFIPTIDR